MSNGKGRLVSGRNRDAAKCQSNEAEAMKETVAGGGGHPCRKGQKRCQSYTKKGKRLSSAEHLRRRSTVFS